MTPPSSASSTTERTAEKRFAWICEFCFATLPDGDLPTTWEWIYQSAVCPDCKIRVERNGGYNVVKGGAYANGAKDPRASSSSLPEEPRCWRCKTRTGVVVEGSTRWCIQCAGESMAATRRMLNDLDEAAREGLPAWPRIMDRVEFLRACIKLHRESGSRFPGEELPADANAIDDLIENYERACRSVCIDATAKATRERAILRSEIRLRLLSASRPLPESPK